MTASRTANLDALHHIRSEQRRETLEDERRGALDFAGPLDTRRFDEQDSAFELDGRRAVERRADGGLPRKPHLAVGKRRIAEQLRQRARQRVCNRPHGKILTCDSFLPPPRHGAPTCSAPPVSTSRRSYPTSTSACGPVSRRRRTCAESLQRSRLRRSQP